MAAGLPLVAPNRGGVTTYANSENAWLSEPHSSSFAFAVRSALADPRILHRKTLKARQTALEDSWECVTDSYTTGCTHERGKSQNEAHHWGTPSDNQTRFTCALHLEKGVRLNSDS
jgi:hypothetical protein